MPVPNLASIRIASQKQIHSIDSNLPYGLEVILQTDTDIEPMAFAVEFSGEIGKGDAGFTSGGSYMQTKYGIAQGHPNVFIFEWKSPAFTPDTPIKVSVFSKSYIKAIKFYEIKYVWP